MLTPPRRRPCRDPAAPSRGAAHVCLHPVARLPKIPSHPTISRKKLPEPGRATDEPGLAITPLQHGHHLASICPP